MPSRDYYIQHINVGMLDNVTEFHINLSIHTPSSHGKLFVAMESIVAHEHTSRSFNLQTNILKYVSMPSLDLRLDTIIIRNNKKLVIHNIIHILNIVMWD